MAFIANVYVTKDKLQTILDTINQKGEKGISLDVVGFNEKNQYGQEVAVRIAQTKEQRESKKPPFYLGNGEVKWTDGKIEVLPKAEIKQPKSDMPF